jgi:hypothetical protein
VIREDHYTNRLLVLEDSNEIDSKCISKIVNKQPMPKMSKPIFTRKNNYTSTSLYII